MSEVAVVAVSGRDTVRALKIKASDNPVSITPGYLLNANLECCCYHQPSLFVDRDIALPWHPQKNTEGGVITDFLFFELLVSVQSNTCLNQVNDMDMKGVTREEAVLFLLSLQDQIDLIVQYRKDEYEQIVASQRGDSFHIKWVDPFINIVCLEYVCDKELIGLGCTCLYLSH